MHGGDPTHFSVTAPDEPAADSTPHEFIDVELGIDGMQTPADEQILSDMLAKVEGIRTFNVSPGHVAIEYEPVRITESQLAEKIVQLGYRVVDVEIGPASAISDALREPTSDA